MTEAQTPRLLVDGLDYSFTEVLDMQHLWDRATFGPGLRTEPFLAHIRKELVEIEADPRDAEEWVDVMILAAGGAMRLGLTGTEVLAAYRAKVQKNEARSWPDWRTAAQGVPIEHVRETAVTG